MLTFFLSSNSNLTKTILAGALLFLSHSCHAQRSVETVKLAHGYSINHPVHDSANWAAKQIEERTHGRYRLEIYPSSQIGRPIELIQAVREGLVEFAYINAHYFGRFEEPIGVMGAPYVFNDWAHFRRFVDGNEFDEVVNVHNQHTGDWLVAVAYLSQKHILSSRKITSSDDFKGLRLRVSSPSDEFAFITTGARAVALAFPEIYTAYQAGVIDAAAVTLENIAKSQFYKVASYLTLTSHATDTLVSMANEKTKERFSENDRTVFKDVFREAALRLGKSSHSQEEQFRGELQSHLEFVDVNRDKLEARAVDRYLESVRSPIRGLFLQIRALN